MNIISGKYKNRKILTPDSEATHPMGSREKIALFNMLYLYLENAEVLDAFSGSGALGLEALSRGAKSVVMVEKSPKAARVIKQNIQELEVENECQLIVTDVGNFTSDRLFDLIIADPPYDNFHPEDIERLLDFLKPAGILALSHPHQDVVLSGATQLNSHSYAAATITLFQK